MASSLLNGKKHNQEFNCVYGHSVRVCLRVYLEEGGVEPLTKFSKKGWGGARPDQFLHKK